MAVGKMKDILGSSDIEMIENWKEPDNAKKPSADANELQTLPTMRKTKIEKSLLRKADLCIVPLAALSYLVSYLVRLALHIFTTDH
jgi:hypothetical protein